MKYLWKCSTLTETRHEMWVTKIIKVLCFIFHLLLEVGVGQRHQHSRDERWCFVVRQTDHPRLSGFWHHVTKNASKMLANPDLYTQNYLQPLKRFKIGKEICLFDVVKFRSILSYEKVTKNMEKWRKIARERKVLKMENNDKLWNNTKNYGIKIIYHKIFHKVKQKQILTKENTLFQFSSNLINPRC